MFPVAGVVVWIMLGMIAGLIAGKITRTEGPNRTMANLGVGLVAAVVGGAIVTFAQNGTQTSRGLGMSIAVAAICACAALGIYRLMHRGRSETLR